MNDLTLENNWLKILKQSRGGMHVVVSLDSHDDGREFVRVEFSERVESGADWQADDLGGYIQIELGSRRATVSCVNAAGDVLNSFDRRYENLRPQGEGGVNL